MSQGASVSAGVSEPDQPALPITSANTDRTITAADFERGFIRAEVISFEDMKACGTMAAAKAKGLVRSEGKDYVMKDGDIVNFLFNV